MSQSSDRPHLVVVAPPKKARYHRRVSQPAEPAEPAGTANDEADEGEDDEVPSRAANG